MTEAEWLAATDPMPMFDFLRGKFSDRKLRLFAVACCRRIGHLLADKRLDHAVEIAERFADGEVDASELFDVHVTAGIVAEERDPNGAETNWAVGGPGPHQTSAAYLAAMAVERASSRFPIGMSRAESEAARLPPSRFLPGEDTVHSYSARALANPQAILSEVSAQADLVRELFTHAFRPVEFDSLWLTPTAHALAFGIYDVKAFDRLPILADALQDAGCDSDELLNHLRQPGDHCRGCWAVDLVLAKQ